MARAWDFQLFWPSDSKEVAARIWQYPILRVPFQGRVGVPIFAFLTGFVCAYKPLKLAYQQSNQPAALQSIARSAFRRPPRLILPAVIATLISFLITCLGGYKTANRVDSFWVRFDAPKPVAGLGEEVRRLFHTTLSTWTNGENIYDRHQWAMRPLLIGAFQVYVVLAATIGMRFRYRIVVHLLLLSYWLINTSVMTETFGANLALGTLLAELSLHRPTQNFMASRARLLTYVVAPVLLVIGLFLGGFRMNTRIGSRGVGGCIPLLSIRRVIDPGVQSWCQTGLILPVDSARPVSSYAPSPSFYRLPFAIFCPIRSSCG
jgi:hypothetical protein